MFDAFDDGGDHSGAIVIVTGGSSGPPTSLDTVLKNRIWALRQRGISTLGYVNFATQNVYDELGDPRVPPPVETVASQSRTWIKQYVTNGVFLDLSWRQHADVQYPDSEDRLADAEGVAYVVRNTMKPDGQDTIAMFNWSVPFPEMQRYVDCLTTYQFSETPGGSFFLSQETTEQLYANEDSTWSWIHDYRPDHFFNIVNQVNSSAWQDVVDLLEVARSRNATGYFVTDQTSDGYQFLPDWQMLGNEMSRDNIPWYDYDGQDEDYPYPYTDCPARTPLPLN